MTPISQIIALSFFYERPKKEDFKGSFKKDSAKEKANKVAHHALEPSESEENR